MDQPSDRVSHSPAPWRIGYPGEFVDDADGLPVCLCDLESKQFEANQRLILRAPELLQAALCLQEVRGQPCGVHSGRTGPRGTEHFPCERCVREKNALAALAAVLGKIQGE